VVRITPEPESQKEDHHLILLGNPRDILPATAIIQLHEEIKKFKDIIDRMYKMAVEFTTSENPKAKLLNKIRNYEQITDNIQKEVTVFAGKLMEKPLTHVQSVQTQAMIRIADEFESVADYLERLATYKVRFNQNYQMQVETKEEFSKFMMEVWNYLNLCSQSLYEGIPSDLGDLADHSSKLHKWADDIRDRHLDRVLKDITNH
jgi:phosphate:Na+ symporter